MTKNISGNYRIIYMGTPHFAVAPLEAILKSEIQVAAVVTVPDKPAGRGLKVQESPVKQFAVKNSLPVLQPVSLKDPEFIEQLRSYNADLFVVVAFRMLPKEVWQMAKEGTINLHASLLPRYRGAAPINHAIMNGENLTGLTTFFIDEKIDTGGIIDFIEIPVKFTTTAGELHDEMMVKGSELLLKTICSIKDKAFALINQNSFRIPGEELPAAPKILKADCLLDFDLDAEKVYNRIRGLSPYPAAFTHILINSKPTLVKILLADLIDGKHKSDPGTVLTDKKSYLYIISKGGIISIKELQSEGKKKMSVEEFLRGNREIGLQVIKE
jgi:methionyl-tRNA formyltransferase